MTRLENIDWKTIELSLRRYLARRVGDFGRATIDDMVQEILLELVKVCGKEDVEEPARMAFSIARFRLIDRLKKVQRERGRSDELEDETLGDPASAAGSALPIGGASRIERIRFVLLEFFRRRNMDECRRLARLVLDRHDWRSIAESEGAPAATQQTLRQRWSRCVKTLRGLMHRDPLLMELEDLHLEGA